VRDAATGAPIADAVVWVKNVTGGESTPIKHPVTTAADGDFWRLLTPGQFEVIVQADGYEPMSKAVNVTNPQQMEAIRVDFALQPSANQQQVESAVEANDQPTEDGVSEGDFQSYLTQEELEKLPVDQLQSILEEIQQQA